MAGFPPITVRQPRPHDIVNDPVGVCGIGTGFEGTIAARGQRRRTQTGDHPGRGHGNMGQLSDQDRPSRSATDSRRTLEVFEEAQDGSDRELNKVVVPVVFGEVLVSPYSGFARYTVQGGNTLRTIAERFYGDADRFRVIFQANRDQIEDPDRIFPGQVLRVPQ